MIEVKVIFVNDGVRLWMRRSRVLLEVWEQSLPFKRSHYSNVFLLEWLEKETELVVILETWRRRCFDSFEWKLPVFEINYLFRLGRKYELYPCFLHRADTPFLAQIRRSLVLHDLDFISWVSIVQNSTNEDIF